MKRLLGLALLLCGLLGCEAVLEDTDMTLDELRQALVEQSGHTGLVTDAEGADYSDKSGLLTNATYYLNSGLRWLNRLWGTPGQSRFYETTLAQGEWAKQIPNLRHARHVYIHDGTTRYRLQYRPLAWLKKMYDEPFDNVDEDRPRYWSRGDGIQITGTELLTNGGFTTDLSDWTAGSGWTWVGGKASFTYAGIGSSISQLFTEQSIEGLVLSFDITISDGATVGIFFWDESDAVPSPIWVAYNNIAESGSYSITLPALTRAGISFNCATVGATVTLDNVSLSSGVEADIITMPPADQDYTLKVYGDFKTSDLSADADENWWTEQHPEFVIRAARIMLELDGHRNISGLEAFKGMCEEDVARLAAEHRFAYISGFTPEEAARYG